MGELYAGWESHEVDAEGLRRKTCSHTSGPIFREPYFRLKAGRDRRCRFCGRSKLHGDRGDQEQNAQSCLWKLGTARRSAPHRIPCTEVSLTETSSFR